MANLTCAHVAVNDNHIFFNSLSLIGCKKEVVILVEKKIVLLRFGKLGEREVLLPSEIPMFWVSRLEKKIITE